MSLRHLLQIQVTPCLFWLSYLYCLPRDSFQGSIGRCKLLSQHCVCVGCVCVGGVCLCVWCEDCMVSCEHAANAIRFIWSVQCPKWVKPVWIKVLFNWLDQLPESNVHIGFSVWHYSRNVQMPANLIFLGIFYCLSTCPGAQRPT